MPAGAPAPSLLVVGTLFDSERREVPARAVAPARYSDDGKLLKAAVDAREAFVSVDARVLTDGGGFATVSMRSEEFEAMYGRGVTPDQGTPVAWRVRCFIRNVFGGGRWYSQIAYYFASAAPAAA